MKRIASILLAVPLVLAASVFASAEPKRSEPTLECIGCHLSATPGIVGDWEKSRHARVTPAEALGKSPLERRVSAVNVPKELSDTVVGCAECHTRNPEKHADTFEHNGHKVHVVVTPEDCATCHPVERTQYAENIMSRAYGNLAGNPVYHDLADMVNGLQVFSGGKIAFRPPDRMTNEDSCYYCHGTRIEVAGMKTRETVMGEMAFPVLSGWPNQGVGRVNPDGSLGSCAACHTRHQFSIEMARKPYTCAECHKGPDVPAYKAYEVSKHGNIFNALGKEWDFHAVPWTVGKDFTAPTCAACHASLVVTPEGEVVAERTHRMNDRISWRIFGLIYAHPRPLSPDTTVIRNKAGLPLPTDLTGEPAADFLIDAAEQAKRRKAMERVCRACHSKEWVDGQFARFENTIRTTNEATLEATKILLSAWKAGAAEGPGRKGSLFDEGIEKKWVELWLFHANSTRFASAMIGADYGVFADGRWHLSRNLREMAEWLANRSKSPAGKGK